MAQPQSQPVVAEVVRSGIVEGHHYGAVVALAPDGSVDWAVGDVERPVLPRSCVKPLQAVGMLRCGLDLPDELLALVCASHSGEPFHVEGVRRILRGAGLSEASLQTPADLPLGDVARAELLRGGGSAAPVLMNCSGKHAGMLATCVARGWDTGTYLSPEHPLQRAILQTVVSLTGDQTPLHGPGALAVDGCGAPAPATSLVGLARAFGLLARGLDGSGRPDPAVARVAGAIRAHPAYVSGSTRDERTLLEAIPGAVGKAGAECCYAVALADGRAFALKGDDGSARVRPVLMAAALARSGVDREAGVDGAAVRATGVLELLGGGRPVGEIRAVLAPSAASNPL